MNTIHLHNGSIPTSKTIEREGERDILVHKQLYSFKSLDLKLGRETLRCIYTLSPSPIFGFGIRMKAGCKAETNRDQ